MKNFIHAAAVLGIFLLAILPVAAQPSNDNFADAPLITGDTAAGTNADATRQAGEPETVAWPGHERSLLGGRSVWWKWVAPTSGRYTIRTGLPDNPGASSTFDTQLGVYTGTLGNLTEIASNESDVNLPSGLSSVSFMAVKGTTYHILVDGFEGQTGSIVLYVGLTRYTLLAYPEPSDAGTVTLDPAQPAEGYTAGTLVTLTATPVDTNVFYGWSGNATGRTNPLTIRINSDKTIIANFAFNSEIIWQRTNGQLGGWYMLGTNLLSSFYIPGTGSNNSWRVAGFADFNADGSKDFLFQNADGRMAVGLMYGDARGDSIALPNMTNSWRAVGAGDFNGDSRPDILFQNTTGYLGVWMMNGTDRIRGITITNRVGPGWKAVDVVDFDGDGDADILFQRANGAVGIWFMNGAALQGSASLGQVAPLWRLVGARDFNGDGKPDLLFQSANGRVAIWLMDGTSAMEGIWINQKQTLPAGWKAVGLR